MFTNQLAPVDSLSVKTNARFALDIKWLLMEGEVIENYLFGCYGTNSYICLKNCHCAFIIFFIFLLLFWAIKNKQLIIFSQVVNGLTNQIVIFIFCNINAVTLLKIKDNIFKIGNYKN